MKKAATCNSRPTTPALNGSATNATNVAQNAIYGASLNRNRSAPLGIVSSLVTSLIVSASDCAQPYLPPVRVGPRRSCMRPETFRSSQMKTITESAINRTMIEAITTPAAITSNGFAKKEKNSTTSNGPGWCVREAEWGILYGGAKGPATNGIPSC